mgnify:CR=1 FL=1
MISFVIANTSKRAVSEALYHSADAAPFIVSLTVRGCRLWGKREVDGEASGVVVTTAASHTEDAEPQQCSVLRYTAAAFRVSQICVSPLGLPEHP